MSYRKPAELACRRCAGSLIPDPNDPRPQHAASWRCPRCEGPIWPPLSSVALSEREPWKRRWITTGYIVDWRINQAIVRLRLERERWN